MLDAERFIAQNELAAQTLTSEDVEAYAEHYAGGQYVVGALHPHDPALYVKMHDCWAAGETVVVHTYNPHEEEVHDVVENFATGREALDHFISIIDG